MTFERGKVRINIEKENKYIKALFLTCGHAVNEYEQEAPLPDIKDGDSNELIVILNMGMFSGDKMKDPISGVYYPICIEVAVLA